MKEPIIKQCSCGRTYTQAQWDKLPGGEIYKWPWGEIHEQRHCVCNSTMSVVLDPGEPDDLDNIEPPQLPAWIRQIRYDRSRPGPTACGPDCEDFNPPPREDLPKKKPPFHIVIRTTKG